MVAQPEVFALLQAIFDLETPAMVRGRLALIGDAAFVACDRGPLDNTSTSRRELHADT